MTHQPGKSQGVTFDGDRVVLPLWQRLFLRFFSIVFVVSATAMLFLSGAILVRLLIALAMLLVAFYAWGASLSAIEFRDAGILVRNNVRSRVVPWPEFKRFVLAKAQLKTAGHLETTDGNLILCLVITPTQMMDSGKDLLPTIERLNEMAEMKRPR